MPFLILVATPHAAFGEMLRMSLEDSGQYQVRLVQSGKEARAASSHSVFQLAIVDAALQDEPFVPLCKELLHQQTGLRLVVIPPENNPNHPSLGGLLPHGYLSRPFYLPDLIDTVSRLLADRDQQIQSQHLSSSEMAPAIAPAPNVPLWLQEPLTLRGYLEKELTNTQALGALIGLSAARPGTGILRANAGKLDDASAHELSSVVFRYWNRNEKTDLMRFIRIAKDKKDYLIYATQVTGDLVLVLIYDTAAPLSLIRPQSKNMAQNLATVPPEGYVYPASVGAPFTVPDIPAASSPQPTAGKAPEVEKPLPQTESLQPAVERPQPVIPLPDTWNAVVDSAKPQLEQYADTLADAAKSVNSFPPTESAESASARDSLNSSSTEGSGEPAEATAADSSAPPTPDESAQANEPLPARPGSVPPFTEEETPYRAAIMEPLTQPLEDEDFLRRLRSGFASGDEPQAESSVSGSATASSAPESAPIEGQSPSEQAFFNSFEEDDSTGDIINLTALLGSIPPPDPATDERAGGAWVPERFAGQPIPTLPPEDLDAYTTPAPPARAETPVDAPAGPHLPDHAERLAADELMAADELLSSDSPEPPANPERIPAAREIKTEPPTPAAGPTPILPQTPPARSLLRRKPSTEAQGPSVQESSPSRPASEANEPTGSNGAQSRPPLPAAAAPTPGLEPAVNQPIDLEDQDVSDLDLEEPPVNPLEDTRPRVVASITSLSQLEAASPALSLLNYTCVLVPRLPQHYLTGELADKLALWVHQLCLAFGWRLEGIAIRPEYLQWSVQVAPAISPGNLVKIIRQRTSLHIFSTYNHLAQQNPSGDFWAPGYLIVSGAQPPSAQLLRDYIVQTRKRQGINK